MAPLTACGDLHGVTIALPLPGSCYYICSNVTQIKLLAKLQLIGKQVNKCSFVRDRGGGRGANILSSTENSENCLGLSSSINDSEGQKRHPRRDTYSRDTRDMYSCVTEAAWRPGLELPSQPSPVSPALITPTVTRPFVKISQSRRRPSHCRKCLLPTVNSCWGVDTKIIRAWFWKPPIGCDLCVGVGIPILRLFTMSYAQHSVLIVSLMWKC